MCPQIIIHCITGWDPSNRNFITSGFEILYTYKYTYKCILIFKIIQNNFFQVLKVIFTCVTSAFYIYFYHYSNLASNGSERILDFQLCKWYSGVQEDAVMNHSCHFSRPWSGSGLLATSTSNTPIQSQHPEICSELLSHVSHLWTFLNRSNKKIVFLWDWCDVTKSKT